jgi:hypothetical protein
MAGHPDLEAEQAYIDHAYACLEATREAASRMTSMVEVGRGGTNQARYERDVIWDTMLHRLAQLDLGNAALCFGRIDLAERPAGGDSGGHGGNGSGNGNGNGNGHGSAERTMRTAAHGGGGPDRADGGASDAPDPVPRSTAAASPAAPTTSAGWRWPTSPRSP